MKFILLALFIFYIFTGCLALRFSSGKVDKKLGKALTKRV
jgi:hypothetical protein